MVRAGLRDSTGRLGVRRGSARKTPRNPGPDRQTRTSRRVAKRERRAASVRGRVHPRRPARAQTHRPQRRARIQSRRKEARACSREILRSRGQAAPAEKAVQLSYALRALSYTQELWLLL